MAKYMLLYRGPATPPEEMTEERRNAIMQDWMAWMEKLGPALADPGNPTGASTSVRGDGSPGDGGDVTGFTVVNADDLESARAMCDGHPFLSDGTDPFSIEIYELVDMS